MSETQGRKATRKPIVPVDQAKTPASMLEAIKRSTRVKAPLDGPLNQNTAGTTIPKETPTPAIAEQPTPEITQSQSSDSLAEQIKSMGDDVVPMTSLLAKKTIRQPQQPTETEIPDFAMVGGMPKIAPRANVKAIKKINRFGFRLGMERTREKYGLVPGSSHGWEPDVLGDVVKTGLEDKPEKRAELERRLGVSLDPKSPFYFNLHFELQDKPHGTLLNFDDPKNGAFHEVVYYAMTVSSIIANGFHERAQKPMAEWYIEDPEAQADAEAIEISKTQEAIDTYGKLTQEEKIQFAKLLPIPIGNNFTAKSIGTALWKYIMAKPENADMFNRTTKMDAGYRRAVVMVKDAVNYNIITRNSAKILMYKTLPLGSTEQAAATMLLMPEHTGARTEIQQQIAIRAGII